MKRVALIALLALAGCEPYVPSDRQALDPMYLVDVSPSRLEGTWYEIATFPNAAEAGCSRTTVSFARQNDGALAVTHRCIRAGQWVGTSGVAVPVGKGALKMKVSGLSLAQNLRVLGLSHDGRTLLLGTSNRATGWLLHRDAAMTEPERRAARDVFGKNGYDRAALQLTPQR